MIQNNLIALVLCFYAGLHTYDTNLLQLVQKPSIAKRPYPAKRYLRIYPNVNESLRAPEMTALININTADSNQLQQLPTIGPKRAEAIIKYREALSIKQFESTEQLLEVTGINSKAFERIRAYIVI